MLILNHSSEYKHLNFIYATSCFAETSPNKVKIKVKISEKGATI